MQAIPPAWEALFGEAVVLDLTSRFVCVGTLIEAQADFWLLAEADVHDLRDTSTTRDQYVLQCRRDGFTPNRQWVWIRREEVVAVSRLADVVVD